MEVIAAIRKQAEDENLPKFKYVEFNGMRMTSPRQVFSQGFRTSKARFELNVIGIEN